MACTKCQCKYWVIIVLVLAQYCQFELVLFNDNIACITQLCKPMWSHRKSQKYCPTIHSWLMRLGPKQANLKVSVLIDTLSKTFFSIPRFNSGIDHFILLKWGIHFRNWESMPEVNSLPMPELPSKRGRNWESMPAVNSWLYK